MARFRRHRRGFTLIETLVVLVISVGLVALMAALYRSVGHAAVSLGGNEQEWGFQDVLRRQARQGFRPPGDIPAFHVSGERLLLLTWHSRVFGSDHKPVLAEYRFRREDRTLVYREVELPAWWNDAAIGEFDPTTLAGRLNGRPERILVRAVDGMNVRQMATEAGIVPAVAYDATPPAVVEIVLDRAQQQRSYLVAMQFHRG